MPLPLQILSRDLLSVTLVLLAFGLGLAAVAAALRRRKRKTAESEQLLNLALGGHKNEARSQARKSKGLMTPIYQALSADPKPPIIPWTSFDWLGLALPQLPASLLLLYALSGFLQAGDPAAIHSLSASLIGLVVAVPLGLLSSVTVLQIGRQTRRRVRAVASRLLQTAAAHQVERERLEQVKNPVHPYDERSF